MPGFCPSNQSLKNKSYRQNIYCQALIKSSALSSNKDIFVYRLNPNREFKLLYSNFGEKKNNNKQHYALQNLPVMKLFGLQIDDISMKNLMYIVNFAIQKDKY